MGDVTHVYTSLEEIAQHFDEIADANRQYYNNATRPRDASIYRERANTWRDAATHLRMAKLVVPPPEPPTEPQRRLNLRNKK